MGKQEDRRIVVESVGRGGSRWMTKVDTIAELGIFMESGCGCAVHCTGDRCYAYVPRHNPQIVRKEISRV